MSIDLIPVSSVTSLTNVCSSVSPFSLWPCGNLSYFAIAKTQSSSRFLHLVTSILLPHLQIVPAPPKPVQSIKYDIISLTAFKRINIEDIVTLDRAGRLVW
jgi:hypothetical protein